MKKRFFDKRETVHVYNQMKKEDKIKHIENSIFTWDFQKEVNEILKKLGKK